MEQVVDASLIEMMFDQNLLSGKRTLLSAFQDQYPVAALALTGRYQGGFALGRQHRKQGFLSRAWIKPQRPETAAGTDFGELYRNRKP